MDGILNINKPKGITSHDVVYKVRKSLGIKKVGHTGTLDPNATGVLPIVIGRATKIADYIMNGDKMYIAEIILGKKTTTGDITGEILEEAEANISEERFKQVTENFIGEIPQIPPMFSAIKKGGIPLYKLARKNVEVEREARIIHINNIVIHKFCGKKAIVEVHCSKGTYIRTLCEDIGEKLGTFACMGELQRTKSAGFSIENSVELNDDLQKHIIPTDFFFRNVSTLTLGEKYIKFLENGNKFYFKNNLAENEVRIYHNNKFYGIYKKEGDFLKPKIYLG